MVIVVLVAWTLVVMLVVSVRTGEPQDGLRSVARLHFGVLVGILAGWAALGFARVQLATLVAIVMAAAAVVGVFEIIEPPRTSRGTSAAPSPAGHVHRA